MATEAVWNLGGRIVADADQYWLLEADAGRLLTFGSQGFLTRTADAKQDAQGRRFYHMDFVYRRVRSGHPRIVLLKQPVGHDGCADTRGFLRKLVRNITLFHRAHDRAFTYNLSFKDKVMVGAVMLPVVSLAFVPGVLGIGLAAVLHLAGAMAHRWLFFAEAEHVVGLYYGKR